MGLDKVSLGLLQSEPQSGISIPVSPFGNPEPITGRHWNELPEQRSRKFVIEMIWIVSITWKSIPFRLFACTDHFFVTNDCVKAN